MNSVILYEELRLIERKDTEVNGFWKGAHLLLFFLAFVFGSFCTFCFHMLMTMFNEKCVLYPKLLSISSISQGMVYGYISEKTDNHDAPLPVDFVGTQWLEKSACYVPTYVPLVSGIFGLVWTTMFLMCSTGSRTLTGLQRPWRALLPVLVFSLVMSAVCVYAAVVTHDGLRELCAKLAAIVGTDSCTHTVNVVSLAYERRVRGVYQATRLTIVTAWLHTACWLLSALLTLVRVALAVDFQLVRVQVALHGDIDKMMEQHERQIRTVSPERTRNGTESDEISEIYSRSSTKIHFQNKAFNSSRGDSTGQHTDKIEFSSETDNLDEIISAMSLVSEEKIKLGMITAYKTIPKKYRFIVKMLYDLVNAIETVDYFDYIFSSPSFSESSEEIQISSDPILKKAIQQLKISPREINNKDNLEQVSCNVKDTEQLSKQSDDSIKSYISRQESVLNIFESESSDNTSNAKILNSIRNDTTEPSKETGRNKMKKSNLKNFNIANKAKKVTARPQKVQIRETIEDFAAGPEISSHLQQKVDEEAQTNTKDKQD